MMEPDRFQKNGKLFVIGMIALLICLMLLAFSVYIFPSLLLQWNYSVPSFIFNWREWIKETYDLTYSGASWIIFLILIILAFICGYISYWASNYIDNQIYGIKNGSKEETQTEVRKDLQTTVSFGFKVLLLIVLVLLVVSLVEWLIAVP